MAAASVASASEVMANNACWFLGSIRRVARGIHGIVVVVVVEVVIVVVVVVVVSVAVVVVVAVVALQTGRRHSVRLSDATKY